MTFKFRTDPGVGDLSAPKGSRPWAEAVRLMMQSDSSDLHKAPELVARSLDNLVRHRGWEQMSKPDGTMFSSLEEFCLHPRPWGLGMPLAKIDEYVTAIGHAPYSDGQVRFDGPPPIHPAAELFPMLVPAELDALAADIRANGLREPVVIFDGQVIDGRNRLAACKLAGVEPRYTVLTHCDDPIAYVVSINLVRRHLTTGQKALIASQILELKQQEARRDQLAGLKQGEQIPVRQNFVERESGRSVDRAGALVGVSGETVKQGKKVREHGAPELAEAMASGEVGVATAAIIAESVPKAEQAELVAKGPKAMRAKAKEAEAAKKAKAPPAPPPPPRVYDELNRRINHAATLGELDEAMTALRRANDDSKLSEGEHSSLLAGYKARHAELRAEAAKAESDDAESDVAALADELRAEVEAICREGDKRAMRAALDAVRSARAGR